jgi:cell shape-determining protein MreC
MADERIMHEPPKIQALQVVTHIVAAAIAFGAGMLLESYLAGQTAASVKVAHEQEVKQARERADEQKQAREKINEQTQALTETLAKERENNAKTIRAKDANLAAFTRNASGVRNALESELSAARSSGEACTSRVAGISEAIGGVFDSVGEVASLAQDLGRENEQLKTENKSLVDKLVGWQKWNAERTQRVVITGQKKG